VSDPATARRLRRLLGSLGIFRATIWNDDSRGEVAAQELTLV
jgi:hypothetical protein